MSGTGQSPPNGHFGLPETAAPSQRRGKWRRAGTLLAAFVVVVGLTATLTAGALIWYGERSVERVDVTGLTGRTGEPIAGTEEISEVLNVLLVGEDSRDGLTDEQLVALGTEAVDGGRTDTIILLQIDPARDKAALLSFPRDLLVTRCDGSRGRINGAYGVGEASGEGGASCLVDTVSDLTGISVNHYIEVNFAGFIDVVDVLGGVTMYIEERLRDPAAGLDLAPGCQQLDGAEALGFVRARKIDNDFGRMARQQRFIRELVSEVTSAGTLMNIPRLFSLVDAAGRAVETDRQLSLADMRRIAVSLRNLDNDNLDTREVPATPSTINGAEMVVIDEDEADELFTAFREGTLAADHLGREAPQAVAADDVPPIAAEDVPPLTVLNGVGIDGLASSVGDYLEERGFEVEDTANAEAFGFRRVRVIHPPGQREEADLVAAAFDDALVEEGDAGQSFTVVLGTDFDADTTLREAEDDDAPASSPDSDDAAGEDGAAGEDEAAEEDETTYQGATAHDGRC